MVPRREQAYDDFNISLAHSLFSYLPLSSYLFGPDVSTILKGHSRTGQDVAAVFDPRRVEITTYGGTDVSLAHGLLGKLAGGSPHHPFEKRSGGDVLKD